MTSLLEFDFHLPPELIAQEPAKNKEQTKLLVFNGNEILDKNLSNLIEFLQAGDVVVFNDAKVIKAKLKAILPRSGAEIEFNLDQELEYLNKDGKRYWQAIVKGSRKVKDLDILKIADDFKVLIKNKLEDGFVLLEFEDNNLEEKLEKYGSIPLPPYIKREGKTQENEDKKNYQTIYAKSGNAVAAPTAGLHFTKEMFDLLEEKNVRKVFVTLNVGAGTFLPVRTDSILDHKMHEEYFEISNETAKIINDAKANGNRIIAVGTTSLRVLESSCDENGILHAQTKRTNIFIHPPYKFKVVDILMTNFHLPKSTLFMLICAFVGKENAKKIYDHAIKNRYRFFSYGDATLLKKTDSISD